MSLLTELIIGRHRPRHGSESFAVGLKGLVSVTGVLQVAPCARDGKNQQVGQAPNATSSYSHSGEGDVTNNFWSEFSSDATWPENRKHVSHLGSVERMSDGNEISSSRKRKLPLCEDIEAAKKVRSEEGFEMFAQAENETTPEKPPVPAADADAASRRDAVLGTLDSISERTATERTPRREVVKQRIEWVMNRRTPPDGSDQQSSSTVAKRSPPSLVEKFMPILSQEPTARRNLAEEFRTISQPQSSSIHREQQGSPGVGASLSNIRHASPSGGSGVREQRPPPRHRRWFERDSDSNDDQFTFLGRENSPSQEVAPPQKRSEFRAKDMRVIRQLRLGAAAGDDDDRLGGSGNNDDLFSSFDDSGPFDADLPGNVDLGPVFDDDVTQPEVDISLSESPLHWKGAESKQEAGLEDEHEARRAGSSDSLKSSGAGHVMIPRDQRNGDDSALKASNRTNSRMPDQKSLPSPDLLTISPYGFETELESEPKPIGNKRPSGTNLVEPVPKKARPSSGEDSATVIRTAATPGDGADEPVSPVKRCVFDLADAEVAAMNLDTSGGCGGVASGSANRGKQFKFKKHVMSEDFEEDEKDDPDEDLHAHINDLLEGLRSDSSRGSDYSVDLKTRLGDKQQKKQQEASFDTEEANRLNSEHPQADFPARCAARDFGEDRMADLQDVAKSVARDVVRRVAGDVGGGVGMGGARGVGMGRAGGGDAESFWKEQKWSQQPEEILDPQKLMNDIIYDEERKELLDQNKDFMQLQKKLKKSGKSMDAKSRKAAMIDALLRSRFKEEGDELPALSESHAVSSLTQRAKPNKLAPKKSDSVITGAKPQLENKPPVFDREVRSPGGVTGSSAADSAHASCGDRKESETPEQAPNERESETRMGETTNVEEPDSLSLNVKKQAEILAANSDAESMLADFLDLSQERELERKRSESRSLPEEPKAPSKWDRIAEIDAFLAGVDTSDHQKDSAQRAKHPRSSDGEGEAAEINESQDTRPAEPQDVSGDLSALELSGRSFEVFDGSGGAGLFPGGGTSFEADAEDAGASDLDDLDDPLRFKNIVRMKKKTAKKWKTMDLGEEKRESDVVGECEESSRDLEGARGEARSEDRKWQEDVAPSLDESGEMFETNEEFKERIRRHARDAGKKGLGLRSENEHRKKQRRLLKPRDESLLRPPPPDITVDGGVLIRPMSIGDQIKAEVAAKQVRRGRQQHNDSSDFEHPGAPVKSKWKLQAGDTSDFEPSTASSEDAVGRERGRRGGAAAEGTTEDDEDPAAGRVLRQRKNTKPILDKSASFDSSLCLDDSDVLAKPPRRAGAKTAKVPPTFSLMVTLDLKEPVPLGRKTPVVVVEKLPSSSDDDFDEDSGEHENIRDFNMTAETEVHVSFEGQVGEAECVSREALGESPPTRRTPTRRSPRLNATADSAAEDGATCVQTVGEGSMCEGNPDENAFRRRSPHLDAPNNSEINQVPARHTCSPNIVHLHSVSDAHVHVRLAWDALLKLPMAHIDFDTVVFEDAAGSDTEKADSGDDTALEETSTSVCGNRADSSLSTEVIQTRDQAEQEADETNKRKLVEDTTNQPNVPPPSDKPVDENPRKRMITEQQVVDQDVPETWNNESVALLSPMSGDTATADGVDMVTALSETQVQGSCSERESPVKDKEAEAPPADDVQLSESTDGHGPVEQDEPEVAVETTSAGPTSSGAARGPEAIESPYSGQQVREQYRTMMLRLKSQSSGDDAAEAATERKGQARGKASRRRDADSALSWKLNMSTSSEEPDVKETSKARQTKFRSAHAREILKAKLTQFRSASDSAVASVVTRGETQRTESTNETQRTAGTMYTQTTVGTRETQRVAGTNETHSTEGTRKTQITAGTREMQNAGRTVKSGARRRDWEPAAESSSVEGSSLNDTITDGTGSTDGGAEEKGAGTLHRKQERLKPNRLSLKKSPKRRLPLLEKLLRGSVSEPPGGSSDGTSCADTTQEGDTTVEGEKTESSLNRSSEQSSEDLSATWPNAGQKVQPASAASRSPDGKNLTESHNPQKRSEPQALELEPRPDDVRDESSQQELGSTPTAGNSEDAWSRYADRMQEVLPLTSTSDVQDTGSDLHTTGSESIGKVDGASDRKRLPSRRERYVKYVESSTSTSYLALDTSTGGDADDDASVVSANTSTDESHVFGLRAQVAPRGSREVNLDSSSTLSTSW